MKDVIKALETLNKELVALRGVLADEPKTAEESKSMVDSNGFLLPAVPSKDIGWDFRIK